MKIKKQTPELLILQENPLAGVIVGAIFLIIGIVMLVKLPFPSLITVNGRSHSGNIPLWLPIVFILSGGIVMLLLSKTTATFDKITAKATITSKSLLKKVSQELSWQQIQSVELREMNDGKGVSYGISLLLTDGGTMPLQNSFDEREGFTGRYLLYNKTKKTAQTLADFLAVQLMEKKASGVYDIVKGLYQDRVGKEQDKS